MKKKLLNLILLLTIVLSYAQCNYKLVMNDSYGDGWVADIFGDINAYVEVDTNGTNIYNSYLNDGYTDTLILTVNDGDLLYLLYNKIDNSWDEENSVQLFDCNGNIIWEVTNGRQDKNTNITIDCSPCTPLIPDIGDCGTAPTLCDESDVNNNSTGQGNFNDLNLTNEGCLVSGENYSNWIYFHAETDGVIGLTITPNNENGGNDDYDFAIWEGYTCPPTAQPIRCSWALGTGDTGLDNFALDVSEDDTGDGWVSPITVATGDEFVMIIDNYSSNSNSFTLTWVLSGGATLDCKPMPVEFISSHYNCSSKLFEWLIASEINNDYYTINIGSKYDKDGLIVEDTRIIPGAGNSNNMINYTLDVELVNKYLELYQTDYNGKTTLLATTYQTCVTNDRLLDVYPNPSDGFVYIDGEYDTIKLYDMVGKEINYNLIGNKIIGLSTGFYVIVVDGYYKVKLVVE